MSRFVLTEKAEEDLNLIWEYIANQGAIEAQTRLRGSFTRQSPN